MLGLKLNHVSKRGPSRVPFRYKTRIFGCLNKHIGDTYTCHMTSFYWNILQGNVFRHPWRQHSCFKIHVCSYVWRNYFSWTFKFRKYLYKSIQFRFSRNMLDQVKFGSCLPGLFGLLFNIIDSSHIIVPYFMVKIWKAGIAAPFTVGGTGVCVWAVLNVTFYCFSHHTYSRYPPDIY